MTKEEAKEKFRLADRLFNESQFGPALKVLTELNAAFPNERHVLYPMARCLTGLGRNAEALDLADRVVRQFDYGPAVDLYKRLKAMKTGDGIGMLDTTSDPALPPGGLTLDSDPIELPPGVPKFDSGPINLPPGVQQNFDSDPVKLPSGLDSLVNRPPITGAPPPPLPTASSTWGPVALWTGLALASVVAMLFVYATAGRPFFEWQAALEEEAAKGGDGEELLNSIPVSSMAIMFLAGYVCSYFLALFPGYWALRIMEALPFNDFGEDMKDIALYTLWAFLLLPVIGIGWLIFMIIMRRHYELSGGKQFIVVVLWFAFDIGIGIVVQILTTVVTGSMTA